MSPLTAKELARAISGEMVTDPVYWLSMLVIALVVLLSGLLSSYLRRKGENLATKEDFDELLKQIKTTTEATEEIKTRIGTEDWTNREYRRIRREKIEELLEAVMEVDGWVQRVRRHYVFSSPEEPGPNPDARAKALQRLYFPELRTVVNRFGIKVGELTLFFMECGLDLQRLGPEERLELIRERQETINQKQREVVESRAAVEDAIEALHPSLYQ